MREDSRQYPNMTGLRIVAGLIDVVVLAIVFGIMVWLFGRTDTVHTTTTGAGVNTHNTTTHLNLTGLPLLGYFLIVVGYYVGSESALRATPGKLITGLRVLSVDSEPLTPGRIALRNVLRIVDGLPILYVVGLVTIAASKRHQRVGDMAAGTTVSRESSGPYPPVAISPPLPTEEPT